MDPEPSSFLLITDIFKPFEPQALPLLVLLFVLLICSALISGSEVAFFSLKLQDLNEIKDEKKTAYGRLSGLLEHPKTLLATILISNNFINVGIVILSSYLTSLLLDFTGYAEWVSFVVQVVVITFLILLFGEVLPKVYANKKSVSFSIFMSGPMTILRSICRPLSLVLVRSGTFIEKRLQSTSENLSVDDLTQALEITQNEPGDEDGQKILEGIVKFGNTTVKQIMKPRMDVVAVDIEASYSKVMELILESGYSRIPVYEENFDNVKGVLYIKDLIPYIDEDSFNWTGLIRDPFYVPENKKIDDLLNEFQVKKIHMAIVVDEFGGTSGLITLEDVIEEIVGEISDEFDDDDLIYSKLDEQNYVFEGKVHLTDLFRVLNLPEDTFEDERGDADTLAGLLLEIAGKFPEKNEIVDHEEFEFKVESLEGRRIKRIKVTRKAVEDNTHEEA